MGSLEQVHANALREIIFRILYTFDGFVLAAVVAVALTYTGYRVWQSLSAMER